MPQDPVLEWLTTWAEAQDAIRAAVLTSTRTDPDAAPDRYSDYDIIVFVRDIAPWLDDVWLADFGPILTLYRDPVRPWYGEDKFCRVTQYEDGTKIDYTVAPVVLLHNLVADPVLCNELDDGYTVLVDKDTLTAGLQPPNYTAYVPTQPTEAEYRELVGDFLSNACYVPKHIWRGDLLPLKYMLDYWLKHEGLRHMLDWRVEIDHGWSLKTGADGKRLQRHLHPDLWRELETTYVGAGPAENWHALFTVLDLMRRVGTEVADALGYAYPLDQHRRVVAYLQRLRNRDTE